MRCELFQKNCRHDYGRFCSIRFFTINILWLPAGYWLIWIRPRYEPFDPNHLIHYDGITRGHLSFHFVLLSQTVFKMMPCARVDLQVDIITEQN